jgi:hypothetical protein
MFQWGTFAALESRKWWAVEIFDVARKRQQEGVGLKIWARGAGSLSNHGGGISRDRLVQPAKLGRIPGLREYITARCVCSSSSSGGSQVCMQMSDSAGILNVRIKPRQANSLAARDNDAVLFQFLLVSQVSRRTSKILFLARLLTPWLIHLTLN